MGENLIESNLSYPAFPIHPKRSSINFQIPLTLLPSSCPLPAYALAGLGHCHSQTIHWRYRVVFTPRGGRSAENTCSLWLRPSPSSSFQRFVELSCGKVFDSCCPEQVCSTNRFTQLGDTVFIGLNIHTQAEAPCVMQQIWNRAWYQPGSGSQNVHQLAQNLESWQARLLLLSLGRIIETNATCGWVLFWWRVCVWGGGVVLALAASF